MTQTETRPLRRVSHLKADLRTSGWVILLVLALMGSMLIFLGLMGLYARQVAETGVLGLIAFLVAFIGMTLFVGMIWTFTFVVPSLAEAAPELLDADPSGLLAAGFILTLVLFTLGWLLFGLASLQAGLLPRGAVCATDDWGCVIFCAQLSRAPLWRGRVWRCPGLDGVCGLDRRR